MLRDHSTELVRVRGQGAFGASFRDSEEFFQEGSSEGPGGK